MSDAFIQALADCHEDSLVDLAALRAQCMAKVAAGGGELGFLTSATLNGKMASQIARMDASELLAAVNSALRLVNDTAVSMTYADFSDLR